MTPQRPIELVNASKACAEAWLKRDAMIDAGDKEGVKAMDLTCDLLQERYNSIYRQWQELGGTSNIDSVTFPPALAEVPQFEDAFCDPRTPEQRAADSDWKDEQDTIADIMAGL
mgnify:CR=1 FL=1